MFYSDTMNTFTSGIKSWKTTVIAIIVAVLALMQEQTDLANWQDWVIPALITAFGILSRDANKSSESSGIVPLVILGLMAAFLFTSCGSDKYTVNTLPYIEQIKTNPEAVVMEGKDVTAIGGFSLEIGGTVVTDQGTVSVGPDGVSGDVVIDLRSGK